MGSGTKKSSNKRPRTESRPQLPPLLSSGNKKGGAAPAAASSSGTEKLGAPAKWAEILNLWTPLITKTVTHKGYQKYLELGIKKNSKHKTLEPGYTTTTGKAYTSSAAPILAIDCEMCQVKDPNRELPVQGLIRVSVTEGMAPYATLYDTLVMPKHPIVDMLDRIHGITYDDLGSKPIVSFEDAQSAVMEYLCQDTIVIGQSLNCDLISLKIHHDLVVDTAFLFALEGDAKGLPSLKDLAKQLLDIDMTKIHDSAVDAAVTAKVANHELMHGPSPPIKKSDKNAGQLSQLRVHRLPLSIAVSDIESFFMQRTKIKPESVENIVPSKSGTHARTTLLFTSPAHANLAFDTLAGTAINDTVGRPEKKIKFTASGVDHGSIHVGKFTAKPKRRRSEGAKATPPKEREESE